VETLAARVLEQEHRLYPEAVRLFALKRLQVVGRQVKITGQEGSNDD
jgi:phosphoribosylglycinamide formyltransferase-1